MAVKVQVQLVYRQFGVFQTIIHKCLQPKIVRGGSELAHLVRKKAYLPVARRSLVTHLGAIPGG